MMKKWSSYGIRAASIGALTLLGAGCSTEQTQATDVWKDPSYVAGPMKDILVIGAKLNDTNRRTLEDGFVSALSTHGIRATPSYSVLPTPLPTKEKARSMLSHSGFDGILVATMKGKNENATVVAGGGVGFWDGYYVPGWGEPYGVTGPMVKFETSLWDPSGAGKVVWTAITESDGPSTGKNFTASLTGKVVPMMSKAGVIPPTSSKQALSLVPRVH